MVITFTEYPTDRDKREGKNGVKRTGQLWSSAPGGGHWVVPLGPGVDLDHREFVRVQSMRDEFRTIYYAVKEDR